MASRGSLVMSLPLIRTVPDVGGADVAVADCLGVDLAGTDVRGGDLVVADVARLHCASGDRLAAHGVGVQVLGEDRAVLDLLGGDDHAGGDRAAYAERRHGEDQGEGGSDSRVARTLQT